MSLVGGLLYWQKTCWDAKTRAERRNMPFNTVIMKYWCIVTDKTVSNISDYSVNVLLFRLFRVTMIRRRYNDTRQVTIRSLNIALFTYEMTKEINVCQSLAENDAWLVSGVNHGYFIATSTFCGETSWCIVNWHHQTFATMICVRCAPFCHIRLSVNPIYSFLDLKIWHPFNILITRRSSDL